nr:alpha/beta hydrolase [Novosphingobium sp. SG751A]
MGTLLALSLSGAILNVAGAQAAPVREQAPVPLWPQGAPAWGGSLNVPVQEEARDGGQRLWNVSQPTLQAFLPEKDNDAAGRGAAVIVAPGGGFRFLSIQSEGVAVARWLAAHGTAAFVLKYRVVQIAPGETEAAMHKRMNAEIGTEQAGEAALADGRLALRYLRAHGADYGIDPHRIGVVGFSAGGHVAGMLAHEARPEDRADFVGLIYGLPFTKVTPPIPAANLPFPPGTPSEPWLQPKPTPAPDALPPIFIAMAQDDLAVGQGVPDYYAKLFAAGYRPETHLYARGGHGFGMKGTGTTVDHWIEEFDWWMQQVLADKSEKRTK